MKALDFQVSIPIEYTLDGEHFQIFRSISRDLHWGHFYFFSFENRPILVFGSILVVGSALRNSHPLKYETLCSQKGSVPMLNVGKINNTFFYIFCKTTKSLVHQLANNSNCLLIKSKDSFFLPLFKTICMSSCSYDDILLYHMITFSFLKGFQIKSDM